MTYTFDQLRKLDPVAIADCSSTHIQSVLTDVIATAIQALSPAVANVAPELPPLPMTVHCVRNGLGDIAFMAYTPEEMKAYARAAIAAQQAAPKQAPAVWKPLTDVQWMNIVNHEHAYDQWSKEDAVHHAVKMTEAKCKEVNGAVNAKLVAAIKGLCLAIDNVSPGPGGTDGFIALLDAQAVAETALAAVGVKP